MKLAVFMSLMLLASPVYACGGGGAMDKPPSDSSTEAPPAG